MVTGTIEKLLMFLCWLCVIWAFPHAPLTYISIKQYIYKHDYQLVEFEVSGLEATGGSYPYLASAVGVVNGRSESMGLGHFYLGGEILPADAEKRFSPGSRIAVYYNPEISNFTFNSRTARFVPPERYERLSFVSQARMLMVVYGPLLLSVLAWMAMRRFNKSHGST